MSVAPRRPKTPPLNAMRAFEAAARHESFVAAAAELNVTAGAISQHIKTLEAWSGTPLFQRQAHGVALTDAGQSLVTDFTAAFDGLAVAARTLQNLNPKQSFHIATLPAIAQLWLPKRLSRIRSAFPEVNFSVTAMESPPSLSRNLFDLAIFFGQPTGGENEICLRDDEVVPVCAPPILEKFKEVGFDGLALLHDQTWRDDWQLWSDAAGIAIAHTQTGPMFSLYSLAVEEAKAGAGALMGHMCLVDDMLAEGTLVRISDFTTQTGSKLILQMPEPDHLRPETEQVASMLV